MNIHSNFIIHWTGRDIECNFPEISPKRMQYLVRLKDDLRNGLFAGRTEKEDSLRLLTFHDLVRLCFTELRLSQATAHANRYGRLGIGFSRDFILKNSGRPVIYIPFNANHDCICILEDNLKEAYEKSKNITDIHHSLKWLLPFVKRMSDERNTNFFDEMEWRIVFDEKPERGIFVNQGEGIFRFQFHPSEIKIIIFPDGIVKQMAFDDPDILSFVNQFRPITVTLDECPNF